MSEKDYMALARVEYKHLMKEKETNHIESLARQMKQRDEDFAHLPKYEKSSDKCEHKNKDSWNHGRQVQCMDCGHMIYDR